MCGRLVLLTVCMCGKGLIQALFVSVCVNLELQVRIECVPVFQPLVPQSSELCQATVSRLPISVCYIKAFDKGKALTPY